MRALLLLLPLAAMLPLFAQPPLARPAPPTAVVTGAPGTRTVYYWAFAKDARGHTAYSDPVVVTNAPDVLSTERTVTLTPAPVAGATEYGILTSRCDAPRITKLEVKAAGAKTYYYWTQARNGRTVWSPVAGPFTAEGCAETPENVVTWEDTHAEVYFLYRTDTPAMPTGWRACVVLGAGKALTVTDTVAVPSAAIITPAGNPAEKPEGVGPYLVGTSKGEAIVDRGQKLTGLKIYDMNTTDPAFTTHRPVVQGYEPGGENGAFTFNFEHRMPSPQYSWDMMNNLSITQRNIAGGLNVYPYNWKTDLQSGKNTYNGIDIHQFNYTPGQHSPYLAFMYNYGVGDNVFLHMAGEQHGQNRTPGDEGTEFFSLHMSRRLSMNRTKVQAPAKAGATHLKVDRSIGTVAGGRGIVNLTQQYTAGQARVEGGSTVTGAGTQWTPAMEGHWISFDADTTPKGIRQWYRIHRVQGPDKLQIFAYAYWSQAMYKGSARQLGAYRICPYTEMADGDANRYAEGLKVTPLTCDWQQGDEVEAIAGPQTTFRLGWWEMGGDFLPQDHVAGLGIAYNGDKPTSEGALITYNWGIGMEVHNGNTGMVLYNTKAGIQAYKESPVLISVIRDDPYRFQLGQNKDGFVIEDHGNRPWVSLGAKGIAVHGAGTIAGNARTRGRSAFSGDGKTTAFAIPFPTPYPAIPYVVASSNLPIGMGVTAVTAEGCTVTFATPPPAGTDNVVVTWMVQE